MYELTLRPNIEAFIAEKENLEILEGCLDRTATKYLQLERQKEKLDFGVPLTLGRLGGILPDVLKETRNFLGVSGVPSIGFSIFDLPTAAKYSIKGGLGIFGIVALLNIYQDGFQPYDLQSAALAGLCFGGGVLATMYRDHITSLFEGRERIIRISKNNTVGVVGVIAHEYTHHVQYVRTDLFKKRRNPIKEGHCRGVERAVARVFAERNNNPAHIFVPLDETAKELKDAYFYICSNTGVSPKSSLEFPAIPDIRGVLYKRFGHHYSIGVAAMCVAEAKHGNEVYQKVIKEDYSFLRVD